jgi:hypothetical protein
MSDIKISRRLAKYIERNIRTFSPSLNAVAARYNIKVFRNLPENAEAYLCPLCLSNHLYILEDSLYGSSLFTMDHYPPKSIGGTKTALVCQPCNSSYGGNLDHHIKTNLQVKGFFEGRSSFPITVSIKGEGTYRIEGSIEKDRIFLLEHNKKSNLIERWHAAEQIARANNEEYKINVTGTYPTAELVTRAYLKAGYLQFFIWAGYDFIFSHIAAKIRAVISGDIDHPLSNHGVLTGIRGLELTDGIYALTNSDLPRTFFACMSMVDPTDHSEQKCIVLVPLNTVSGWNEQAAFKQLIPNTQLEFCYQKYENFVVSKDNFFPYMSETRALLKKT